MSDGLHTAIDSSPPSTRRRQADRSEDTQRKLIKATIRLLKTKGYAGCRTAAAADEAGVSRGGMMHHFASKDALVLAAVEDILVRARRRAQRNLRAAAGTADPIGAMAADAREFFFHEDFAVVLDVALMGGKNPEFKSHIQRYAQENRAPLEAAWEALLIEHGLDRQEAEDVLALTFAIVRGLAIRSLRIDDPEYFARLLDAWEAIIRGHLAGKI